MCEPHITRGTLGMKGVAPMRPDCANATNGSNPYGDFHQLVAWAALQGWVPGVSTPISLPGYPGFQTVI